MEYKYYLSTISYLFRRLLSHLQGELLTRVVTNVRIVLSVHKKKFTLNMAHYAPEHVADLIIIHVFYSICALVGVLKL
jgi:hypothetical protein